MSTTWNWPLLFMLVLLSATARGAHITDQLLAGLYTEPAGNGRTMRVLPSGTPVERLKQRDGFTLIRLSDNSEGWVETRYITDNKPAKVQLLELQAKHGALKHRLQETERALKRVQSDPRDRPPQLTPGAAAAHSADSGTALWLIPLLALLPLLGFIAGVAFKNHRLSARGDQTGC